MSIAFAGTQQFITHPLKLAIKRLLRYLRVGPLFRWRFSGFRPQNIIAEPVDLHLASPEMAHEYYHGNFALAGRIVHTGSISPFAIEPPSLAWEQALHDFSWLRHMDAAKTPLASAHSRSLTNEWFDKVGKRIRGTAWQTDVAARRLTAWLCHARMLLDGSNSDFQKRFLSALGFHFRYLRTAIHKMEENESRLQTAISLVIAAISLPVSPAVERSVQLQLVRSLEAQILPDGGHISRNPVALLRLLTELLSLRELYTQNKLTPPRQLVDSIERMFPALRFFIHKDNSLAHFNGVGPILPKRLEVILGLDETHAHPFSNAPHSGYQRLQAHNTLILADTGITPPRAVAHQAAASCLSFEMSSSKHRFIINAGVDPYGPMHYRTLARSTAAHSTATLNDCSSGKFYNKKAQQDPLLLNGPTKVRIERIDGPKRIGFVAQHNGYAKNFKLIHERGIALSTQGNIIEGYDRFFSIGGAKIKNDGRDHVAIRFHLHSDVEVRHDGESLRLEILGGDTWSFIAPDADIILEDSIDFANLNGPQKNQQIVLNFRPALHEKVRWRFTRMNKTASKTR